MDDLPKDYDAVVLGTGMTECIVAAALSRIGQKVLHLDRNDYYSGDWGTFHFKGIQDWISIQQDTCKHEQLRAKEVDKTSLLKEGESTLKLQINANSVSNVVQHTYVKDCVVSPGKTDLLVVSDSKNEDDQQSPHNDEKRFDQPDAEQTKQTSEDSKNKALIACDEDGEPTSNSAKEKQKDESVVLPLGDESTEWSVEKLNKEFRKFNIDLHPRVLFSRGPMVELLISSDIAKYCEFRTVTRVLTNLDGKLEQVPCSRSDVFSSKQVSMIEKRMLMKLLTFCLNHENEPEQYAGFENETFKDFLASKKLTKNVSHYVQHAIAMVPDSTRTLEGLKATQRFLQSLGRYGNTAFLWPLYGSGELPQCFCRMCAVFGGTYCLRRTGAEIIIDSDNKCQGIIDTEGVRLNAKWVVAESSYLTTELLSKKEALRNISRGILLTNKSILEDKTEHITLLSVPQDGDKNIVTILELSSSSLACPKDIYMVHLSCRGRSSPEKDFEGVTKLLFQPTNTSDVGDEGDCRPKILWSVFFTQNDTSGMTVNGNLPDNMFVVDGPNLDLDFDYCIKKAKTVFDRICPGEEFLPKAPNPEDIIFDDGATAPNDGSGFETDQHDPEQTTCTQNVQREAECQERESESETVVKDNDIGIEEKVKAGNEYQETGKQNETDEK